MNKKVPAETRPSRMPYRISVLLCLVTFPLIWVGGLVTTFDAGMAVPDWPNTYGYNLFLYPLATWWSGPWDLFIEHGHRLLGSLAGLVTIGLVGSLIANRSQKWVLKYAIVALILVIFQGMLGGIRVLAVEQQIAKLHGCVGPGFFAFSCAIGVLTSRLWRQEPRDFVGHRLEARVRLLRITMVLTVILAYIQLILGASMRHIAIDAPPTVYRSLVIFHVLVAFLVLAHTLMILGIYVSSRFRELPLAKSAVLLAVLVLIQVGLGSGTWIVKFGWPEWMGHTVMTERFVPVAKSLLQTNTVTAHVAFGSLILGVSTMLTLAFWRLTLLENDIKRRTDTTNQSD